MNYKQKAIELSNKMMPDVIDDDELSWFKAFSKKCAAIACDEIISALDVTLGHLSLGRQDNYEAENDRRYWLQVKQEINKL